MGRKIWLILLVLLILVTPLINSEETAVELAVVQQIEKHEVGVIVELEKDPEDLNFIEKISATDVELEHLAGNQYTAKVNEADLEDLLKDPNVLAIEEDEIFEIQLAESIPVINATVVHAKQFDSINLTGAGQAVCVLDSGANSTHTSLGGRIIAEHCFCDITDLGSGGCCSDNTNENEDAEDDHGHGTHVTGIVGGNGSDVLGVAPAVNIVSVKVTNASGSAFFSDITEGVQFCVSNATQYNISAITISLGGGSFSAHCDSSYTSLTPEINSAWDNNISVTVSTGNTGSTTTISSPACINRSIAVSSTTDADAISGFSDRNNITDIMAPGSTIISTAYTGGTESRSGTSMAAPHVAGAIALLQQYKKNVENRPITAEVINNTVTTNGTSIDDSGGSGNIFTRLDILASLIAIDQLEPALIEPNTSEQNLFIYDNLTFQVNSTDVNLETVWVEGNWSGSYANFTMSQVTGSLYNYTLNNDSFSAGDTFQWRVHANDSKGNENVSSFFSATILSGGPIITLSNPPNNTLTNNASVVFNFTATDQTDLNFTCNLYLSSTLNQTNATTLNGTVTEFHNNLTDGDHNWFVSCKDLENITTNSSTRLVSIDTVFPLISSESFISPLELGDNQSYSLNISDARLLYANFSHLGTNTSLTNSSTNFSTTFITVQNGSRAYTVYTRDDAENLNTTNGTFIVQDTVTGPRVIKIEFTSSLAQGATQNISAYIVNSVPIHSAVLSVNASNNSMINSSAYSFSYSFATTNCGTVPFTIFSNDSNGDGVNNASTFEVTDCSTSSSNGGSSSSGGGGGGSSSAGGGASAEPSKKVTRVYMAAGPANPIDFSIDNENIPVNNVKIDLINAVENVKVIVEALDSKPSSVEEPIQTTYKYLDLSISNFGESDISSAEIGFTVPSSWLSDNNIDSNSVNLLRYTGSWEELPTTLQGQSGDTYSYKAITPGFSTFAIVGDKLAEEAQAPAEEEIATIHENATEGDILGAPEEDKTSRKGLAIILVVLGVIFGVVAVAYPIIKRKRAAKDAILDKVKSAGKDSTEEPEKPKKKVKKKPKAKS